MPTYNQQMPFTRDDCMLPRTMEEAFGIGAMVTDIEDEEIAPDEGNAYAITGLALMIFWLIMLLACVMPTKDSLGASAAPMRWTHLSTIHIHQRVCDMKECKMVDVTLHPRVI